MKIKILYMLIAAIFLFHCRGFSQPLVHKFIYSATNYAVNGVKMKKLSNGDYLTIQGGFMPGVGSTSYGQAQILRCDSTYAMKFYRQNIPVGIPQYITIYDFVETSNGDLVFSGMMKDTTFLPPLLIFKTDSTGNLIWAKLLKWPASASLWMEAVNVFINSVNNIVVVGNYTDVYSPYTKGTYFLEMSLAGNKIHDHLIKGEYDHARYRGFMEPNGDLVMPFNKCGVLVTDSAFNKKFYFSAQHNSIAYSTVEKIIKGYNNDYIIAVGTRDTGSPSMYRPGLACFSSTGQFKWWHSYAGGSTNIWEYDVVPAPGQTYLVSVERTNGTLAYENFLLQVDTNGNLLNTYKSPYNGAFYFMDKLAPDRWCMTGAYQQLIINSVTYGPMSFVVTDSLMQNLCLVPDNSFTDSALVPDAFNTGVCSDQTPMPGLYLANAPLVLNNATYNEIPLCTSSAVIEIPSDELFSVFPNPVSTELIISSRVDMHKIHLSITDISGREIYHKFIDHIHASSSIDLTSLNKGFYFLSIKSSHTDFIKKFVKQ